jgi:acyl transferase domain-containing protein/acyl carrier protein
MKIENSTTGLEIAIIGMACRFPHSPDIPSFWSNLIDEVETAKVLSDQELSDMGVEQAVIRDPLYVKSVNTLEDKDFFDSAFFGYRHAEAKLINPAHRVFHECVWEGLEDAGYAPKAFKGSIGLYAGANEDLNWRLYSLIKNSNQEIDDFSLGQINNKDYLVSLISYKLNLQGPSISINTACSTSLVAVNLACKGLLLGETKIAIAGGVSISTVAQKGYYYQEGSINSRDGHCRAFDENASGTISGEGAGVVILKRLTDAINEGDQIYAVIKGSAVNNDGNNKVGFTAPSVEGQVNCIRKALSFSKIAPETISYIEAHGTGTPLGDPIEIRALNEVFGKKSLKASCALGSVKTNIGHLDTAAGIAGLIKTVLCLKNKKIAATLNFENPSSKIDFDAGPFYVNTKLKDWQSKGFTPKRAAVSSFGIGGTNAHIILEEAPDLSLIDVPETANVLVLSAKTESSLKRYLNKFNQFLSQNPNLDLSAAAYTFQVGREHFSVRLPIHFMNRQMLTDELNSPRLLNNIVRQKTKAPVTVFMFSGQGSQYLNMGKGLYLSEPFFRNEMDTCFSKLLSLSGKDFKNILFSENQTGDNDLNRTINTQPLIFILQYSLGKFMFSLGVKPNVMIGHSIGEYAAACLSGLFEIDDALKLVLKRGELMEELPLGVMLSISLPEANAHDYINENIYLAAVNSPNQFVLSGSPEEINTLELKLIAQEINYIKLNVSRAFHSAFSMPIIEAYMAEVKRIPFKAITIPFISNISGTLITQEEASSPAYWTKHMSECVRFSDGLKSILYQNDDPMFIEVGAGHTLSNLLKQQNLNFSSRNSVNLLPGSNDRNADALQFYKSLGYLWAQGINIDWKKIYEYRQTRRLSLPAYSFERLRYPTEVNPVEMLSQASIYLTGNKRSADKWFYQIIWKHSLWLPGRKKNKGRCTLIFTNRYELGEQLKEQLLFLADTVIEVRTGENYRRERGDLYFINPDDDQGYKFLFQNLKTTNMVPDQIVHTWGFDDQESKINEDIELLQNLGYNSLLNIIRNHDACFGTAQLQLDVIGNGWYNVWGNEVIQPIKSLSLGALKVIPLEFPNVSVRAIDITEQAGISVIALLKELEYLSEEYEVAIRGGKRFVKGIENINLKMPESSTVLRKGATYLITGANGGMGKLFAEFLAEHFNANLILISRSELNLDFLLGLQAKGSKVQVIKADVSDYEFISSEFDKSKKLFKTIDGIIHTAGVSDSGGAIIRRNKADDQQVFKAKVIGTIVLSTLFKNENLDFFVNCSSLSASLPSFGEVAYIASNLFLDAFAEAGNLNYPVISIEWPALQEIGMAFNSSRKKEVEIQNKLLVNGIAPSEAVRILDLALYLKLPVPVISSIKIDSALIKDKRVELEQDFLENIDLRERPDLLTPYVLAVTQTEKRLKIIFEAFFQLKDIGAEDDFFELGADSLKGMILLSKIKKEFNIEIGLKELFENPTIYQLSREIDDINLLFNNNNETPKKKMKL